MRPAAILLSAAILLPLAPSRAAHAAGCLAGASMGAAAGHFLGRGHAILGAIAGCAFAMHEAARQHAPASSAAQAPSGTWLPPAAGNVAVGRNPFE
jgi:hypothetical protein